MNEEKYILGIYFLSVYFGYVISGHLYILFSWEAKRETHGAFSFCVSPRYPLWLQSWQPGLPSGLLMWVLSAQPPESALLPLRRCITTKLMVGVEPRMKWGQWEVWCRFFKQRLYLWLNPCPCSPLFTGHLLILSMKQIILFAFDLLLICWN